jgi:hypothetical protein
MSQDGNHGISKPDLGSGILSFCHFFIFAIVYQQVTRLNMHGTVKDLIGI